MSKSFPIDSNSRLIPALNIGFGKTFDPGIIPNEYSGNIVRLKAIGDTVFRLASQPSSVIMMSAGQTEYFFIPADEQLEIVSGSLNIMM
jgi:hypothetical protein